MNNLYAKMVGLIGLGIFALVVDQNLDPSSKKFMALAEIGIAIASVGLIVLLHLLFQGGSWRSQDK